MCSRPGSELRDGVEEEAQAGWETGIRGSHPGTKELVCVGRGGVILRMTLGSEDGSLGLGPDSSSCFCTKPGSSLVWLMPYRAVLLLQGLGHCPNQTPF